MKCVNCSNDAVYKVDPQVANIRHYCRKCLPSQYFQVANAGVLDILDKPPVDMPAVKKTKKTTTAPDSTVVDPAPTV